jgi:two-component system, LytTR family, response regulator
MSHSVVIVDDEPPARAKLRRFISEFDDFQVVAEAEGVETAVVAMRELTPDVLYLDVQLGTRSGFEVLDSLRGAAAPVIVFTTAYSEHAVRAFEVQALDYLLKPFDRDRFLQSAARVRAALVTPDRGDWEERMRRMLAALPGRAPPQKQILIRDDDRAYFLSVEDIDHISAAGNYVEVHTGSKMHLIREPLSSFASQLAPEEFLRVHRSHVVRIGFIAEMRPMFHGDYELVLRNGERLPLTRRYKQLLPETIRDRL